MRQRQVPLHQKVMQISALHSYFASFLSESDQLMFGLCNTTYRQFWESEHYYYSDKHFNRNLSYLKDAEIKLIAFKEQRLVDFINEVPAHIFSCNQGKKKVIRNSLGGCLIGAVLGGGIGCIASGAATSSFCWSAPFWSYFCTPTITGTLVGGGAAFGGVVAPMEACRKEYDVIQFSQKIDVRLAYLHDHIESYRSPRLFYPRPREREEKMTDDRYVARVVPI